MKIKTKSLSGKALEKQDYQDFYEIEVDGKEKISASDYGEPEDNTLGRNLNFIYKITGLMEKAYNAGKNGEDFKITHEEVEEW